MNLLCGASKQRLIFKIAFIAFTPITVNSESRYGTAEQTSVTCASGATRWWGATNGVDPTHDGNHYSHNLGFQLVSPSLQPRIWSPPRILVHAQCPRTSVCVRVYRQVRRVPNCRAETRHGQHPAEPWAVPHHGRFRHLLLHQHLQRGELGLRAGPQRTHQGLRGQLQRRTANHLPWPYTSSRPQHHRQHGSVMDYPLYINTRQVAGPNMTCMGH